MKNKIIASVLTVASAFSMAGPVGAITDAEYQTLLDQFAQLQASYTALLAQISGQATGGAAVCFNTDLSKGMTSNDVKNLQIVLNKNASTQVASSGAGSPGSETTYFGSLTFAAVKNFQSSKGVINTGYVGPLTRAQLNALYCTPVTTTTTVPGETTTTTVASGEEGYFTYKLLASPSNGTSIKKGDVDKAIMSFTLKANNSAINVERMKFNFNKRAWLSASKVALYEGSTLVEEVDITSSSFEEVTVGTSYNLHLTDLAISIDKGETKTFTVKLDVPASPTNTDLTQIQLAANAIRGTDGAALNVYTPDNASTRTFAIADTTTGALELNINSAAIYDATEFISDTDTTEHVTLAKFDIKAKYRDIRITSINNVNVVNNTANNLNLCIPAIELWDGSTMLGSFSNTATTGDETADFTDLDINIAKDVTKTLTIKASIAEEDAGAVYVTPGDYTNVTLVANETNIVAEDDLYNTVETASMSGGLTGKNVYFYVEAPVFALLSKAFDVSSSSTTTSSDAGDVSFVFSVTASGGDIYLPKAGNSTYGTSAVTGTRAIYEDVDNGDGTPTATTTIWTCISPATESGTGATLAYKIVSGNTAQCTFSYSVVNTGASGYYTAGITSMLWSPLAALTGIQTQTWGFDAFEVGPTRLGI